ncbi:protein IQ-DOMAIN 14-like [Miscanthus floridulus]|uniref:protein IQ-DOMAIN 14-like n=1 Tax=Miscanthus floridulus TaxID=154761 RepID=UPI0034598728
MEEAVVIDPPLGCLDPPSGASIRRLGRPWTRSPPSRPAIAAPCAPSPGRPSRAARSRAARSTRLDPPLPQLDLSPPPPANGSAAKGSLRPDPCLVAGKKVEGRRIRPSPTAGEPATPAPLSAPGLRASGPRREAGHAREAVPPLRNAAPLADEAEPPHLRAERPPRRAPPPCQEE